MSNIKEVAALAGVSVATVSRVINRNGYVSKATEEKVLNAMEELQYEPSAIARGLAGKHMATIAIIVPDITNPFFPELVRAVEDKCREHEFGVFLCNSDNQSFKEKSYLELLKRKRIDGIIFATNSLEKKDVDSLEKSNIPFVVLDRAPFENTCDIVRANNYEGAVLAVEHLLDVGCKRIAHIYGPLEIATARERMRGYEDTVKDLPWYSPSLMIAGDFQINGGMNAIDALLARHSEIDGIFVGNDLMAIGALKALHRRGIRVPDDVAVCGFDGIAMTEITEPELTTVAQPTYDMGKLAAKLLINKIKGKHSDYQVHELDVQLLKRKSSAKGGLDFEEQ